MSPPATGADPPPGAAPPGAPVREAGGQPDAGRTDGAVGADAPVGPLRGAGVDVDVRRAGQVVLALCLVTLAVLVVVFGIAGARKNAQLDDLHAHGVPVEVTVSGCLGLMGGSGSNVAGYACRGTFTLDGHRYRDNVPGTNFYEPGATLRAITVASDPGLLATARGASTQQASWRVFLLPGVLLAVLVVASAALVGWHRRGRRPAPS